VYYHFSDKSTLFTESLTAVFSRVRQHTLGILMLDLPLRERLQHITLAVLSVSEAFATFETAMFEAVDDLSEDQLMAIRGSQHAIHLDVMQFLSAAAQRGEIAKGDPKLRTYAYMALLSVGHFRGLDNKPHFPDRGLLAEGLVDLLFRGLDAR
ncbi:transcriptional regulator, TetR family, partial [mine drainage metagenome]